MLRLLTDLTDIVRHDFGVSESGVITNSVTGTWLTHNGDGTGLIRAATDAANGPYALAWQCINQNNTNVAGSFSPDTVQTQHLTLLLGSYRAKSDRFVGTPAITDILVLSGIATHEGMVAPIAQSAFDATTMRVLGTVIGTESNFSYLGVTYASVMEYWRNA